jgi:hypothetical protein
LGLPDAHTGSRHAGGWWVAVLQAPEVPAAQQVAGGPAQHEAPDGQQMGGDPGVGKPFVPLGKQGESPAAQVRATGAQVPRDGSWQLEPGAQQVLPQARSCGQQAPPAQLSEAPQHCVPQVLSGVQHRLLAGSMQRSSGPQQALPQADEPAVPTVGQHWPATQVPLQHWSPHSSVAQHTPLPLLVRRQAWSPSQQSASQVRSLWQQRGGAEGGVPGTCWHTVPASQASVKPQQTLPAG